MLWSWMYFVLIYCWSDVQSCFCQRIWRPCFHCLLSVVAEPVRSQSLEEKRSRSLEDKPAEPKVDRHGRALFPCPSVIDSLCILLNQGPSHPVTSPSCVHPENFSRGGLTVFFKFAGGHIFLILWCNFKKFEKTPPMTPPPRSVHVLLMKLEITYIKWYVHIFQKVNSSYFIIITSSYHFLMTGTQFTVNVLHFRSVW